MKLASVIEREYIVRKKRQMYCKGRENDSVSFVNDGHDLVFPYLLFTFPPAARRQNI